jgi:hypothetical protein
LGVEVRRLAKQSSQDRCDESTSGVRWRCCCIKAATIGGI